jgi:hypothetical protein
MGVLLPLKLEKISDEQQKKSKPTKKCVCGKHRHKSKGAAEAQLRALKKLQDSEFDQKDFKPTNRLQVTRYRACEMALRDGFEVWHCGHR